MQVHMFSREIFVPSIGHAIALLPLAGFEGFSNPQKMQDTVMISKIIHSSAAYVIFVPLSAVALTFIINKLGLILWLWWSSRRKDRLSDSASSKYWRIHE
jgi:hypothetical protein